MTRRFRHYKNGRTYELLERLEGGQWAGNGADPGLLVRYRDDVTWNTYYRPASEFFGYAYDPEQNKFVPRYVEVKDELHTSD